MKDDAKQEQEQEQEQDSKANINDYGDDSDKKNDKDIASTVENKSDEKQKAVIVLGTEEKDGMFLFFLFFLFFILWFSLCFYFMLWFSCVFFFFWFLFCEKKDMLSRKGSDRKQKQDADGDTTSNSQRLPVQRSNEDDNTGIVGVLSGARVKSGSKTDMTGMTLDDYGQSNLIGSTKSGLKESSQLSMEAEISLLQHDVENYAYCLDRINDFNRRYSWCAPNSGLHLNPLEMEIVCVDDEEYTFIPPNDDYYTGEFQCCLFLTILAHCFSGGQRKLLKKDSYWDECCFTLWTCCCCCCDCRRCHMDDTCNVGVSALSGRPASGKFIFSFEKNPKVCITVGFIFFIAQGIVTIFMRSLEAAILSLITLVIIFWIIGSIREKVEL